MPALATWAPEDGVLGAVAPLALATTQPTALVVDLDPRGPHYSSARSLRELVEEGPHVSDLSPTRTGVAVLANGGIGFADSREVIDLLLRGWPAVVLRLPPQAPMTSRPNCSGAPVDPRQDVPPAGAGRLPTDCSRLSSAPPPRGGRIARVAGGAAAGRSGVAGGLAARGKPVGDGVAAGMGRIVVNQAAINRIAARLLESGTELSRRPLLHAAIQIAAEEDPLGGRASAAAAVDSLLGLGPLEPLLADETISDILVNGPREVWIERAGRLERSSVTFADGASIAAAVERVIAPIGLRLDHASPVVDARLPDGSRLHAVLPPIAPDGPIVAIRRFTNIADSLDTLHGLGALSPEGVDCLRSAVVDRRNILVCGGTGTGKTTLLNVLSGEIPPGERVVTIEDAAELALSGHVVRLESRAANSEGAGAISIQQLVRHGLRLRPDRIIVGEVRGAEAIDMIQAMATGHAGSMSTVHARDAAEALWRLEVLAVGGDSGLAADAVRALLRSGLDLVVVMGRVDTSRVVRQVVAVEADRLEVIA